MKQQSSVSQQQQRRLLITFDHLQRKFNNGGSTSHRPKNSITSTFKTSIDIFNFFREWRSFIDKAKKSTKKSSSASTYGDINWLQCKLHDMIYACLYGCHQETIIARAIQYEDVNLEENIIIPFIISYFYHEKKYDIQVVTELVTSAIMAFCLCYGMTEQYSAKNWQKLPKLLVALDGEPGSVDTGTTMLVLRDNILYSLLYSLKRYPVFIQIFSSCISYVNNHHILLQPHCREYVSVMLQCMQFYHSFNMKLVQESILPCIVCLIQIANKQSQRMHDQGKWKQDFQCCCELLVTILSISRHSIERTKCMLSILSQTYSTCFRGFDEVSQLHPTLVTILREHQPSTTPTTTTNRDKGLFDNVSDTLWTMIVDKILTNKSNVHTVLILNDLFQVMNTIMDDITSSLEIDIVVDIQDMHTPMLFYFGLLPQEQIHSTHYQYLQSFLTKGLSLTNRELSTIQFNVKDYESHHVSSCKKNIFVSVLSEVLFRYKDRFPITMIKKYYLCLCVRCLTMQSSVTEFVTCYPNVLNVLIEGMRDYYDDEHVFGGCCKAIVIRLKFYKQEENRLTEQHMQTLQRLGSVIVQTLHHILGILPRWNQLESIASVLLSLCQLPSQVTHYLMSIDNLVPDLFKIVEFVQSMDNVLPIESKVTMLQPYCQVLWHMMNDEALSAIILEHASQLCFTLRCLLLSMKTLRNDDWTMKAEIFLLLLAVLDQTTTTTDVVQVEPYFQTLCMLHLQSIVALPTHVTLTYTTSLVVLLETLCSVSTEEISIELITLLIQTLCYRSRWMTLKAATTTNVFNEFMTNEEQLAPLLCEILRKYKTHKAIVIATIELIARLVLVSSSTPTGGSMLLFESCWLQIVDILSLYVIDVQISLVICSAIQRVVHLHSVVVQHLLVTTITTASDNNIMDVLCNIGKLHCHDVKVCEVITALLVILTDTQPLLHGFSSNNMVIVKNMLNTHYGASGLLCKSLLRLVRCSLVSAVNDSHQAIDCLPAMETLIQILMLYPSDSDIGLIVCYVAKLSVEVDFQQQTLKDKMHSINEDEATKTRRDRLIASCMTFVLELLITKESNGVIIEACCRTLVEWCSSSIVDVKWLWIERFVSCNKKNDSQYEVCLHKLSNSSSSYVDIDKHGRYLLHVIHSYGLMKLQQLLLPEYRVLCDGDGDPTKPLHVRLQQCIKLALVSSSTSSTNNTTQHLFVKDEEACRLLVACIQENKEFLDVIDSMTSILCDLCHQSLYYERLFLSITPTLYETIVVCLNVNVTTTTASAGIEVNERMITLLWRLLEDKSFHQSIAGRLMEAFSRHPMDSCVNYTNIAKRLNTLLPSVYQTNASFDINKKDLVFLLLCTFDEKPSSLVVECAQAFADRCHVNRDGELASLIAASSNKDENKTVTYGDLLMAMLTSCQQVCITSTKDDEGNKSLHDTFLEHILKALWLRTRVSVEESKLIHSVEEQQRIIDVLFAIMQYLLPLSNTDESESNDDQSQRQQIQQHHRSLLALYGFLTNITLGCRKVILPMTTLCIYLVKTLQTLVRCASKQEELSADSKQVHVLIYVKLITSLCGVIHNLTTLKNAVAGTFFGSYDHFYETMIQTLQICLSTSFSPDPKSNSNNTVPLSLRTILSTMFNTLWMPDNFTTFTQVDDSLKVMVLLVLRYGDDNGKDRHWNRVLYQIVCKLIKTLDSSMIQTVLLDDVEMIKQCQGLPTLLLKVTSILASEGYGLMTTTAILFTTFLEHETNQHFILVSFKALQDFCELIDKQMRDVDVLHGKKTVELMTLIVKDALEAIRILFTSKRCVSLMKGLFQKAELIKQFQLLNQQIIQDPTMIDNLVNDRIKQSK